MVKRRFWTLAALTVLFALVLSACGTPQGSAPAAEAPVAEAPAEEAASEEAAGEAAPAEEAAPAAEEGEKVIIFGLYQEPEMLNPYIRVQTAADDVGQLSEDG